MEVFKPPYTPTPFHNPSPFLYPPPPHYPHPSSLLVLPLLVLLGVDLSRLVSYRHMLQATTHTHTLLPVFLSPFKAAWLSLTEQNTTNQWGWPGEKLHRVKVTFLTFSGCDLNCFRKLYIRTSISFTLYGISFFSKLWWKIQRSVSFLNFLSTNDLYITAKNCPVAVLNEG